MTLKFILSLVLTVFILRANAIITDEPVQSVTKSVQTFRILTIEDHLNVILLEGSSPSVKIEGDSKKIHSIILVQKDDQLVLSKKGLGTKTENVIVYVTVSDLRILEITGDAHVQSANKLSGDLLWVKLAGNGEINLETTVRKVLTTSWANGKILIRGNYQSCSTYRSESGRMVTAYSKL